MNSWCSLAWREVGKGEGGEGRREGRGEGGEGRREGKEGKGGGGEASNKLPIEPSFSTK